MFLREALMELSADYCCCWRAVCMGYVLRIMRGTMRAARSLLNFHWFPPDCLCECGSQLPSIRKDVKYRARQTRIESGRGRRRRGKESDSEGRERTDEKRK